MVGRVRRIRVRRIWIARFLISLSASLTLPGCATIAPVPGADEQFLRAHYVLAHEDGFAIRIDREQFVHKKLSRAEARADIRERIIAGIDAHALRLWQDRADKTEGEGAGAAPLQLMLYAHGGLNGYAEDFKRMRTLLATPADCASGQTPSRLFASAACPSARSRYYPVFVNWNSEAWDSIQDDLLFIRFGNRVEGWETLLSLTAPFVAVARLAEAVFNAMNGFAANVRTFKDSDPDFWDVMEGGSTLIPRFLTTPVVKAFGTSAWQIMNRRAGLLVARELPDGREGVLWSLIQELDRRLNEGGGRTLWKVPERPDVKVPIEITLVGHSMGTIVLNRALVASRELGMISAVKRVVYLAAAASIKDAEAVRLLERGNHEPQFWSFSLHQRDEARERTFLGLAPRGTLLVWVDDFFEPVVEVADQRYGKARGRQMANGNCEWDGQAKVRPRSHAALNEPKFLEAALRRVDDRLFVATGSGPATVAECVLQPHKEPVVN